MLSTSRSPAVASSSRTLLAYPIFAARAQGVVSSVQKHSTSTIPAGNPWTQDRSISNRSQNRSLSRSQRPSCRFLSSISKPAQADELQLTLAIVKPTVCAYQPDVSAVLKEIKRSGLNVARSSRLFWTSQDAHKFYAEHRGKFYYDRLILGMISGPSLALALYGPSAITKWRSMMGPTKAYKGKWEDATCLRARYGLGDTRNGFHGSDSPESAKRELGLIFEGWDSNWWLQREQGKLPADQDGKLNPLSF